MKIRLSTLLLLVLVIAISLGWYLDRNAVNRTMIEGAWYSEPVSMGYSSELNILTDGSFTKRQNYEGFSEIYGGDYKVGNDGRLIFNVTYVVNVEQGSDSESSDKQAMNARYNCRWAIDKCGYLLLDAQEVSNNNTQGSLGIKWDTYTRDTDFKPTYETVNELKELKESPKGWWWFQK